MEHGYRGAGVKLPRNVNGEQAARALKRFGFVEQRQPGSRLILRRANRKVVAPMHRPIKPGALKGLIDQAGLSVMEFVDEL